MSRKSIILILIISLCFTFILTSCSKQKILKANSPDNASWLMKSAIDDGDYNRFKELFTEKRSNSIPIQQFNNMKKITTSESSNKHYELITFTNGKMLLVLLTPEKVKGLYKIEDVREVPDDMKTLFQ